MAARIIDGKAIAAEVRAEVAADVKKLQASHGVTPGLAVVLVGEDPASKVYVRNKAQQTVECGMQSFEYKLPDTTSEHEILTLVQRLNANKNVNGILVQLPLPKHVNAEKILNAIHRRQGRGWLPSGQCRPPLGWRTFALVPCTPTGSVILAKTVAPSLAEGHECRGHWAFEHCGQAGGRASAAREAAR